MPHSPLAGLTLDSIESTTAKADDPVPTKTTTVDGKTSTAKAPFAVVTQADGDIVFPVTGESKPALQSLFDEVTSFCAGKKLRKRTGQCELDYLSRPGVGGGILEGFDLPTGQYIAKWLMSFYHVSGLWDTSLPFSDVVV